MSVNKRKKMSAQVVSARASIDRVILNDLIRTEQKQKPMVKHHHLCILWNQMNHFLGAFREREKNIVSCSYASLLLSVVTHSNAHVNYSCSIVIRCKIVCFSTIFDVFLSFKRFSFLFLEFVK